VVVALLSVIGLILIAMGHRRYVALTFAGLIVLSCVAPGLAGGPLRAAMDPWVSTTTEPEGLRLSRQQQAASGARFRRHQN
jgi:hypothetical protein